MIIRIQFCQLLAGVALALLCSSVSYACQLASVWEPYSPYQYQSEDGTITGLDIDLLRAVAKEASCTIQFENIPWKRALLLLKEGDLHIASGASKTHEREQYAFFSDAYREEIMHLYVQKRYRKKWRFTDLEGLSKSTARVGTVRGYSYGSEFEALRNVEPFKSRITQVLSDEQNLDRLMAGREDLALIERFVASNLISRIKDGHSKIAPMPINVKTGNIHFLFSKLAVKPDVVSQFNQALIRVIKNGQYQAIVDRYLGNTD